jgi:hypothetical protein
MLTLTYKGKLSYQETGSSEAQEFLDIQPRCLPYN